jgi:hypothetical protein
MSRVVFFPAQNVLHYVLMCDTEDLKSLNSKEMTHRRAYSCRELLSIVFATLWFLPPPVSSLQALCSGTLISAVRTTLLVVPVFYLATLIQVHR